MPIDGFKVGTPLFEREKCVFQILNSETRNQSYSFELIAVSSWNLRRKKYRSSEERKSEWRSKLFESKDQIKFKRLREDICGIDLKQNAFK